MSLRVLITFIACLLVFTGCEKENIKPEAEITSVEETTDPFAGFSFKSSQFIGITRINTPSDPVEWDNKHDLIAGQSTIVEVAAAQGGIPLNGISVSVYNPFTNSTMTVVTGANGWGTGKARFTFTPSFAHRKGLYRFYFSAWNGAARTTIDMSYAGANPIHCPSIGTFSFNQNSTLTTKQKVLMINNQASSVSTWDRTVVMADFARAVVSDYFSSPVNVGFVSFGVAACTVGAMTGVGAVGCTVATSIVTTGLALTTVKTFAKRMVEGAYLQGKFTLAQRNALYNAIDLGIAFVGFISADPAGGGLKTIDAIDAGISFVTGIAQVQADIQQFELGANGQLNKCKIAITLRKSGSSKPYSLVIKK